VALWESLPKAARGMPLFSDRLIALAKVGCVLACVHVSVVERRGGVGYSAGTDWTCRFSLS
jgi:hypothetical protein